jgi:hypothetical protein
VCASSSTSADLPISALRSVSFNVLCRVISFLLVALSVSRSDARDASAAAFVEATFFIAPSLSAVRSATAALSDASSSLRISSVILGFSLVWMVVVALCDSCSAVEVIGSDLASSCVCAESVDAVRASFFSRDEAFKVSRACECPRAVLAVRVKVRVRVKVKIMVRGRIRVRVKISLMVNRARECPRAVLAIMGDCCGVVWCSGED